MSRWKGQDKHSSAKKRNKKSSQKALQTSIFCWEDLVPEEKESYGYWAIPEFGSSIKAQSDSGSTWYVFNEYFRGFYRVEGL